MYQRLFCIKTYIKCGKKFVTFFPLDNIKKRHELFPTPNIYIYIYVIKCSNKLLDCLNLVLLDMLNVIVK